MHRRSALGLLALLVAGCGGAKGGGASDLAFSFASPDEAVALDLAPPPDLVILPDLVRVDPCAGRVDCAQCPDLNSCGLCCVDVDPRGYSLLVTLLAQGCSCGTATDPCNAACADACSGMPAGRGCQACLATATLGMCSDDASTKCFNDPMCEPFFACLGVCPPK